METLFLLRHGETDWNKENRVMGRREIPLNASGIAQAKHMAGALPDLEIDAIYSSPVKRALQTSRILVEKRDVPTKIDANLTEVNFGPWEGYRYEDLIRDESYRRFLKTPLTAIVPGGETIQAVQKRGLAALRSATREFPDGRCLFVSHGDVIRAIIIHYLRRPPTEYCRLRIDTGSLSAIETQGLAAEVRFINRLPNTGC